MQNGLNDAPVLAHEPVRAKSLSFYEPRFTPNFRTNHNNDVLRPRDQTLSVVVQRAVNNLAERLCSSKISGLAWRIEQKTRFAGNCARLFGILKIFSGAVSMFRF